jgi:DNA-binding IclR family transcriptional regulator
VTVWDKGLIILNVLRENRRGMTVQGLREHLRTHTVYAYPDSTIRDILLGLRKLGVVQRKKTEGETLAWVYFACDSK